ncbi:hypothetical protein T01_12843 [Trichinella spiralis]|uniref:Uncharacterized protein n=1 Tax=Trichinella spiralis TaxID=6334 RepID=A0A0V1AS74_TRISP|nr:hypothetical protein T01_12843 [Trichinella spiralis]
MILTVNPTVRETVGTTKHKEVDQSDAVALKTVKAIYRTPSIYTSGVRNLRIERAAENVRPTMNDAKLKKFLGKQNISSYAPHSMLLELA